jgi:hypothetical protein
MSVEEYLFGTEEKHVATLLMEFESNHKDVGWRIFEVLGSAELLDIRKRQLGLPSREIERCAAFMRSAIQEVLDRITKQEQIGLNRRDECAPATRESPPPPFGHF